jgi:hypothetical protein
LRVERLKQSEGERDALQKKGISLSLVPKKKSERAEDDDERAFRVRVCLTAEKNFCFSPREQRRCKKVHNSLSQQKKKSETFDSSVL